MIALRAAAMAALALAVASCESAPRSHMLRCQLDAERTYPLGGTDLGVERRQFVRKCMEADGFTLALTAASCTAVGAEAFTDQGCYRRAVPGANTRLGRAATAASDGPLGILGGVLTVFGFIAFIGLFSWLASAFSRRDRAP